MASSSDQAKLRKMRKRHRYARFSGDTTKFLHTRVIERILREGDVDEKGNRVTFRDPENQVRVKQVEILVGPVSLSKQVVNGSRSSVNTERMETYFSRVRTKDQPLTIAEVFGIHGSKYQKIWDDIPSTNKVNLLNDEFGRLDMIWHGKIYFFVEVDTLDKVIKRSRDYRSLVLAKTAARCNNIKWVEFLPIK